MKKIAPLQLLAILLFMAATSIYPEHLSAQNFPEIKATTLKAMMDNGEELLLINPLSDIEYNANHIPGSINIPLQNMMISRKLPKDKKHLIITYCLGPECLYSTDAAILLSNRGYTNIKVFKDGIPGWIEAGYSVTASSPNSELSAASIDASELHANLDKFIVVDIRPPSVYHMGHLPNSRAMPMSILSIMSSELPKDGRIVIVDHAGIQCKKAAQWLVQNGFTNVSVLKDGLKKYTKAGYELEK